VCECIEELQDALTGRTGTAAAGTAAA
jgi:hypothetical protein